MFYGNIEWDISWAGFYDFILNELFEERIGEFPKFIEYLEAMKHVHVFIPYKDIVFISDRPIEINLNPQGRLHADLKPAFQYSDRYSLFYLNGVRVGKEIVQTSSDKLPAELILKEKNAEVRREIVRKIGTERLCIDLKAECIDKMDDYELLILDLKDGRKRPYLKMKNPSIDTIHIEGVHPDCKTVAQALAFRNGTPTYVKPVQLT